jgi:hypothetical protein
VRSFLVARVRPRVDEKVASQDATEAHRQFQGMFLRAPRYPRFDAARPRSHTSSPSPPTVPAGSD